MLKLGQGVNLDDIGLAAERGRSGESYILNGDAEPLARIFREMARLMGIELKAKVLPRPAKAGAAIVPEVDRRHTNAESWRDRRGSRALLTCGESNQCPAGAPTTSCV